MRLKNRWRTSATWAVACLAVCLTLWDTAWAQSSAKAAGSSALQQAVTHAMAGRRGTAVVIEATTGKVLAAYHLEVAARREALPGSSIKTFTLLTLLEADKVNEQTTLMCKRVLMIGGHNLDCTHPEMQQPFDPATALAYSCNTYFATMATRLTPEQLRSGLSKYGIGTP